VFAIIGFQTAKVFALLQSVMDDVLRKQLIRIAFLLARTVLTGLLAAPSVSPPLRGWPPLNFNLPGNHLAGQFLFVDASQ